MGNKFSGYPGYIGGQVLEWLLSKGIDLRFPRGYPVQRAMIAARPDMGEQYGTRRWRAFLEEHKRVDLGLANELWLRRVLNGE